MRSADSDDGVLNRRTSLIFGSFHSLLNGGNCFVQFHDHAFARASRLSHPVAAIAQAAVGDLHHQGTRLRASYINCR